MTAALLEMRGIVKRYGAVHANDGIDLDVGRGRVLGLLGENGSGKSTLMKVLFGMTAPDEGAIVFNNRELSDHTPGEALAAGIGMVHQHFMLVDALTVAENVMLGWRQAGRWLRKRQMADLLRQTSERYGLDLNPSALVADLSLGQRQRVEVLKALMRGADLLILDEPTSNLSPPEVERLFVVVNRLRAEGRSVIFISHKLGEVLEICDDIVVLRDGRVVAKANPKDATRESLAHSMVGRDLGSPFALTTREVGKPLLSVIGLQLPVGPSSTSLHDVSFDIRSGEIVTIVGVDGNGQLELTEAIAGLRPVRSGGQIRIEDHDVTQLGASGRIAAGLAYIPADRGTISLVPSMTIAENLALRDIAQPAFSTGPWLKTDAQTENARRLMKLFDIRAPDPDTAARQLSGGNQQKIVIARELDRAPKVLVALQPTWGLDPNATRFVLDRILTLRDSGAAILYVTTELEEGLALGNRIGVMFRGRVVAMIDRADVELKRIGLLMASGSDSLSERAA
jgi:general nucleoside transport system ATP-binding protein